jgi:hypothetical protein
MDWSINGGCAVRVSVPGCLSTCTRTWASPRSASQFLTSTASSCGFVSPRPAPAGGEIQAAQKLGCAPVQVCTAKRFDGAGWLYYPRIMPSKGQPRDDACWRKSRIAARILLHEEAGKLTRRDVALGRKFAFDKGVTPRLIDQAIHGIRGKKNRLERERGATA